MKRRKAGYVVGRKSVRRQEAWTIREKARDGRGQKFVTLVSKLTGVELRPGLEVTFLPEQRDGTWCAVHVKPKPQFVEGSMRKLILIIAACLAVPIVASAFVANYLYGSQITDWRVETRAYAALDAARDRTVEAMLESEVVDEAVRAGLRAAVGREGPGGLRTRAVAWAVRDTVFMHFQCMPVFGELVDDVYKECEDIRRDEVFDTAEEREQNAIAPTGLVEIFSAMRPAIFEPGRDYFAEPDHVRAFYHNKLDVMLDEVRSFNEDERSDLGELIIVWMNAFQLLVTPDLEIEHCESRGNSCLEFEWSHDLANRRHTDGGHELTEVYSEVLEDFWVQVSTIKVE